MIQCVDANNDEFLLYLITNKLNCLKLISMKNLLKDMLESYFKQNQVKNVKLMTKEERDELGKMLGVHCANMLINEIETISVDDVFEVQSKVMKANGWMDPEQAKVQEKKPNAQKNCSCCRSKQTQKHSADTIQKVKDALKKSNRGRKPNVLTAPVIEANPNEKRRGRTPKNLTMSLYSKKSLIPGSPDESKIYGVYERAKGKRANIYYGVIDETVPVETGRNQLRTIYARTLGVNYLNVSTFMAHNEQNLKPLDKK